MTIRIDTMIFLLIMFRPFISFLGGSISEIGVISLAVLDLLLLIYILKNKFKISTWIIILITIILSFLAIIQSNNIGISIRDGSKFITFIIIINLCVYDVFKDGLQRFILKYKKPIKLQIVLLYLITFIHTFDISKYSTMYNEKVFTSIFPHSHTLAYFILLMIVMINILYDKEHSRFIYNILMLISIYFLILSSARLATIAGIIMIFVFNKDYIFFLVLTLLGSIYIKFKGVENVSFINKFNESVKYGSISSGRDILWKIDIKYFKDSMIMNKVIGNGLDLPYNLHLEKYGSAIWSHNDFFNILLVYGIIGLSIYFYTILNYVVKILSKKNYIGRVAIFLLIILVAFGNGVYLYTDFIIMLAILPIIYDNRNKDKGVL